MYIISRPLIWALLIGYHELLTSRRQVLGGGGTTLGSLNHRVVMETNNEMAMVRVPKIVGVDNMWIDGLLFV